MDNGENIFSLKGKTALLTGGAGLYGTPIADALAFAGAKLYIASRDLDNLEQTARNLCEKGADVTAKKLDLSDEQSILALCDDIYRESGSVDILVNNAVARVMPSFDAPAEAFELSMHINITGTFLISRAFGNRMAECGSGSIINISSIQGHVGPEPALYEGTQMLSLIPDYFVHKGGMEQMTRFMASYYGQRGIRCNSVVPGGLYTEKTNPIFLERYSKKTMLGRMANTEDIKGVIVFLASDASAYITGASIPVDGGYLAK